MNDGRSQGSREMGLALGLGLVGLIGVWLAATDRLNPLSFLSAGATGVLVGACAASCLLYLALRPVWRPQRGLVIARVVTYLYFALLFLGVASLNLLDLLGRNGYPIAATSPLPPEAFVRRAFLMALAGGAALVAGIALTGAGPSVTQSSSDAPPRLQPEDWQRVARLIPLLIGVGAVGGAIVGLTTGQVALLSTNIDAVRYRQGTGLGFASLMQFELLLASALCAIGLVLTPGRRGYLLGCLALAGSLLLLFRVERTSLIFVGASAAFALMVTGRSVRRTTVAAGVIVVVAAVLGLGLLRFNSTGSIQDPRVSVVRPVLDVSPEFREQAFAFSIYPKLRPFARTHAAAAVASSVFPSATLGAVGIDKREVYTDVSREYSQTMRELGYYGTDLPIRVGIAGEMWVAFGWLGLLGGLGCMGALVGWLARLQPQSAEALVSQILAATLLVLGLVTPLAALAPLSLMVLAPIFLMRLLSTRTVGLARPTPIVSSRHA